MRTKLVEALAGDIHTTSPQLFKELNNAFGLGHLSDSLHVEGPIDEEDYSALSWVVFALIAAAGITGLTLLGGLNDAATYGFLFDNPVSDRFGIVATLIAICVTGLLLSIIGVGLAARMPVLGYLAVLIAFLGGSFLLNFELSMLGEIKKAIFAICFLPGMVYAIGNTFGDKDFAIFAKIGAGAIASFFLYQYGHWIFDTWWGIERPFLKGVAIFLPIVVASMGIITGKILSVSARAANKQISGITAATYGLGIIAIVFWTQMLLLFLKALKRGRSA